jgi:hypothetical protein
VITSIEGLPENVVGIRAEGKVHSADYKSVADPAVEAALAASDSIRLLYVLGEDFDGYSGGAMWADTKLGISNRSAWERIAVVTDHQAYADGVKAMGWLMPAEVRVFPVRELDEAKSWVSQ